MTKDPRTPTKWTNAEIEQDAAGYLAAQRAYQEDQDRAKAKQAGAEDLERFTAAFVANGGTSADAEASYRALRNERAAQAARTADEAAQRQQHGNVMAAV
jgi:hypothetical protein